MKFYNFKSLNIEEKFVLTDSISPLNIHEGAAEFTYNFMMNPEEIPWVGTTISPCNSPVDGYIEHPSSAFEYYSKRGVEELTCELKMMGSRAIIVYDSLDPITKLHVYSRGMRNIRLSADEFETILNDCEHFSKDYNLTGFVADAEMLPWNRLSANLINNDFIIPALAYAESVINSEHYDKYEKVLKKYINNDELSFHIFDVIAISMKGTWIADNFRITGYNFEKCNILNNLLYSKRVNLNIISEMETVKSDWLDITENQLYEGMVFKPKTKQLKKGSNIILPYMKVRGKEYLRLVYGIEYPEYIDQFKNRRTKWKRMQSIGEYILCKYILHNWIEYKNTGNVNKDNLSYIFAYMGLRKSNRAMKIDATL